MIRNVIFDWSGTLVDDLPAVWQATNHVFRQAGIAELSLAEFRAEFCLPFKRFYDRYTPQVPLAKLEEWFHGHFRGAQDQVVALPHAAEFLAFCRAHGLRTALLSTVAPEHYAVQARNTGFGAFLDFPYVEVWDKRGKIHEILRAHEFSPAETLFIGDMEHDIETARHGGVQACAVLTGYNTLPQLRAAAPDLIVEHLGELQCILEDCQMNLADHCRRHRAGAGGAELVPVATVGALIFHPDRQRVLLVRTRKWSNLWGIPGGKIKGGESSEVALRRELREETGLEVEAVRFVLVQDAIRPPEFYREAHFLLLNYTCVCAGEPKVCLNDEAQEFQWIPLTEAGGLPLNQPTQVLLERVRAGLAA